MIETLILQHFLLLINKTILLQSMLYQHDFSCNKVKASMRQLKACIYISQVTSIKCSCKEVNMLIKNIMFKSVSLIKPKTNNRLYQLPMCATFSKFSHKIKSIRLIKNYRNKNKF